MFWLDYSLCILQTGIQIKTYFKTATISSVRQLLGYGGRPFGNVDSLRNFQLIADYHALLFETRTCSLNVSDTLNIETVLMIE